MHIRKSTYEDLDSIMCTYEFARQFMRSNGNAFQWINGYPQIDVIKNDINAQKSYVVVNDDNDILGTFYFAIEEDITYKKIYQGEWLSNNSYGVIHRIASNGKEKGIGKFVFNWCFNQIPNIKIDTHKKNIPMQNLLEKNGFKYCGIIYLLDGDERVAFQKTK